MIKTENLLEGFEIKGKKKEGRLFLDVGNDLISKDQNGGIKKN